jgi:hypothetical protein
MLLALVLAATTIDCTGVWSARTSEQALAAQFGKANVKRETIYGAEGTEEPGTVLYPNDPKRRVEIVWKNKKGRKSPEWLRVPAGSEWNVFGLRAGTTLAELVKRNGGDFRFSGFGWDYGGNVTDWRGGAMASLGGKSCRVAVELVEPVEPFDEKALENVSGDREISTTSPHLKKLKVRVSELTVMY